MQLFNATHQLPGGGPVAEHTSLAKTTEPASERHVLVPVRWGPEHLETITRALEVAALNRPGTIVTLLHVIEPVPAPDSHSLHWLDAIDKLHHSLGRLSGQTQALLEQRREEMAEWIRNEAPSGLRSALKLRGECRLGEPEAEILRFAKEKAVDLVILCERRSRKRWPLKRSLVSRILKRIDQPVMIVRPQNAGAAVQATV
ncbi:MAG: universal stress protein [Planctomycetes bacterium]|nr:universal stress protein [Planctomycetota bacterium]